MHPQQISSPSYVQMYTAVYGTWLNILLYSAIKSSCIVESNINVTCSCYYVILAPPPSKGNVLEQVMVVLNGQ